MSKINRASIRSKLNYCQQLWPVLRNAQVRTVLTVATVLSIIVIYQSGMLTDADALTRYFNCTIELRTRMLLYHSKMSIIVMTRIQRSKGSREGIQA